MTSQDLPPTTPTSTWAPSRYICPQHASPDASVVDSRDYVLLLLNQPIRNKAFFLHLWNRASFRVCGDGGGNRLYDALNEKERRDHIPNAICGDLDSLRGDVRAYYSFLGVPVHHDPDQESTDFGKCLAYIEANYILPFTLPSSESSPAIFVYNALGGRIDHVFHSIHQLYAFCTRQLYLVSEDGLAFLLPKGQSSIILPQKAFGPVCGIIPIGESNVITTKGLVWDVSEWETRFGGRMSTSNRLEGETVNVMAKEPVLFTVEIKEESF